MLNPVERLLELLPERDWDWELLSHNPAVTWKSVQRFPEKPWDWKTLSRRLPWSVIQAHPKKPWNYTRVLENPLVDFSEILELLKHPDEFDWPVASYYFSWNIKSLLADCSGSSRASLELVLSDEEFLNQPENSSSETL
jgi:hypothetical protein